MYQTTTYKINIEKVKTLENVLTILKELKICIDYPSDEMKMLCDHIFKEDGRPVKPCK